jgi:hypothetical protein
MIRLRREKAREYDEEATEVVDVPSSVGGRLRLMCKRHAQVRSTRIALENALPRRRACSMSSDVILEANSIMQTPFDTRHNAQSMKKEPQSWLKAAGSLMRIGLH